jgi:hypothetical protein
MTRVLAMGAAAVLVCGGCGGTVDGRAVAGAEPSSAGPATTTPPGAPAATSAATPTAPPTAAAPSGQQGATDVLGPYGWGPLTIGQDPAAAGDTGAFVDAPPPDDRCVEWTAVFVSALESAVVSPTIGIAALTARPEAVIHTPEGVRIGSTAADVHTAYPEFDIAEVDTPNGALIAAPGNPKAVYRLSFDESGLVSYLTLEAVDQDCYG